MGLLYHVAVRQVALKQIVAACRRTGPPPDLAAERLAQALDAGSIDERCELTVREGERVAVALRAIGRDGTASGLRTAIDLARQAARAALLGYVARAHAGRCAPSPTHWPTASRSTARSCRLRSRPRAGACRGPTAGGTRLTTALRVEDKRARTRDLPPSGTRHS
jgi:hypothetical protein